MERLEEIYRIVAKEVNLPKEVVKEVNRSYYRFIKECIEKLPLSDIMSEEDFNKLRCNFNLPSLGKLSVSYDRYIGVHKKYEYFKKLKERNEDKEDSSNVY